MQCETMRFEVSRLTLARNMAWKWDARRQKTHTNKTAWPSLFDTPEKAGHARGSGGEPFTDTRHAVAWFTRRSMRWPHAASQGDSSKPAQLSKQIFNFYFFTTFDTYTYAMVKFPLQSLYAELLPAVETMSQINRILCFQPVALLVCLPFLNLTADYI